MTSPERTLVINCDLPLAGSRQLAAIEIVDGVITAVTAMADAPALGGSAVVDAGGNSVIPAFTDAHVHVVESGIELMRCDLTDAVDRASVLATIADYAISHPEAEWVVGRGWALADFQDTTMMIEQLDRLVPDRPAYLANRDGHSAWVNSVALRLAGVRPDTPDPAGGRIERLPDGRLAGLLHESAMQLVSDLLPALDPTARRAGLLAGQERLLSFGVTGWQEAIVGDFVPTTDVFSTYLEVAESGELVGRATGNLWLPRTGFSDAAARFAELRAQVPAASRFQATGAKVMYDGVCETFTAATSRPYLADTEYPTGLTFFAKDELLPVFADLDAAGFDIHIHAIGDRAVGDSIELLESVAGRSAGRSSDRRHQIAHLQLTNRELIHRMAATGIIANVQPLWAHADEQMLTATLPFLDPELAAHQYEFASMVRAGVALAFGSDWPVSTPSVFEQLHVAVNRSTPGAPQPLLPAEKLTRPQALLAATVGSAHASRQDGRGRLAPGLEGDVVILDRNLEGTPDAALREVQVAATLVGGRVMFER
ncbi:amidohydrolase [Leifsonia aquatica]|uniref:amidohydrolase n=1 Tax=Leifsonia aquatica TaxID=144185 RepID=UPI0004681BE9|nr:amidohydrolase [Leifsonia aquatica]